MVTGIPIVNLLLFFLMSITNNMKPRLVTQGQTAADCPVESVPELTLGVGLTKYIDLILDGYFK